MTLFLEDRDSAVLAPVKPRSCFLAHAYERQDWGGRLVQGLQIQEVECISPFRDIKPREFLRIAFNGAKDTSLFIADLSIPNANVVFELGMAVGLGRIPLMIVQSGRSNAGVPNALKDVKHYPFADREQLVSVILERLEKQERGTPSIDFISPFDMGPWELAMQWHICYFPAKARGDINRTIDRTLSSLKRGLQLTHADEVSRLHSNLYQQLNVAAISATNVFRFLHPDESDSTDSNLDTAFLAGFSYGAGKQTICIIPQDLEGILADIRDSSIVFETETELETELERCVMEIKTDIQQARARARSDAIQKRTELKAKEIQQVRFGDVEASRDELLLQAYEEWKHTDDVLDGKRPIVIGRKGTGKTALKRYIEERQLNPDRTFFLSIDPIDSDLEGLYSMRTDHKLKRLDIPKLGGQAKRLWLHLLPIYLASSITPEVMARLNTGQQNKANIITESLNKLVQQASISYYAALQFSDYISKDGSDGKDLAINEEMGELTKDSNAFLDELARNRILGYILIDSLDKMWHTKSIIPMAFVFGLIDAVRDISIRHSYRPILLLRQDIFRILQQFIPETDKLQPLYLDWSKAALWSCIAKRIRAQLSSECYSLEECVDCIFERVNGRSVLDDILGLVSLKPREAILLCTYCWDRAIEEDRTKITEKDVELKAKTLSEDRLFWLHDEYHRGMPWMAAFAYAVVSTKGVFTLDEWCKFIDSVLRDQEVLSDSGDALDEEDSRRDQVTSDLIKIGVIKYVTDEKQSVDESDFLVDPDFSKDVDQMLPSILSSGKRGYLRNIFQRRQKQAEGKYILRAQYKLAIS